MSDRAAIAAITRLGRGDPRTDQDLVAVEAPLEVVLVLRATELGSPPALTSATDGRTLGIMMRTPGDDRDLVLGWLYSEGLIRAPADVSAFELQAGAGDVPDRARVTVGADIDLEAVTRRGPMSATSACGLCGRLTWLALDRGRIPNADLPKISSAVIVSLPDRIRAHQAVFDETGGLHAAAFCSLDGEPWIIREDIGRHNAVDKVVGAALAAGTLPATETLLAVSGRVAYEIVQKAVAAGIVAVVAVGAPSSLAVDAARAAHVTLVGFARDGRFNVYAGRERIES